jgi:hypothetical protein
MRHHVDYRQWTGPSFADGAVNGTALVDDALVIETPIGIRIYTDPRPDRPAADYEFATWSSPEVAVSFGATEIVPSWNAETPPGTWVEVSLEAAIGPDRRMYVLGRWAETTDDVQRTTVPMTSDRFAEIEFDVLKAAAGRAVVSWHLHVTLLRRLGSDATPSLTLAGAMASAPDPSPDPSPTTPSGAWGVVLEVPAYSQALHRDEYPSTAVAARRGAARPRRRW